MTDDEIIKALERMSAEDADGFSSDILDLIKRQQAKTEELSEVLSDHIRMEYAKIKSEAITEFAERLKDYAWYYDVNMHALDRLEKEMLEAINGA